MMRRGLAGTYQSATGVLALEADGLAATSDLSRFLWAGSLDLGPQPLEGGTYDGVVIGSYLADRLGASVGSGVRLAFPPQQIGTGRMPPVRRYVVTGIFSTGYAEFDGGLSVISLAAANRDLQLKGAIDGIRLRLDDPLQAESVARGIEAELSDGLIASPWMSEHGSLYASIQLEKWSFYLGLSLIVVIAGFNIISIVSLNVAEQRKEIGILKAMGANASIITRIFALTGLRLGVVGVVFGTVAGVVICLIQIVFEPFQLPGDLFIVNALPVELRIFDIAVVSSVALLLCLVFAILPARSAAGLDPIETLRT
jgi:lipoprotein-releasing system permease protein